MSHFRQTADVTELAPGTELRRDRPAEQIRDDGFRTPALFALATTLIAYLLACSWMPADGKLAVGAGGVVLLGGMALYTLQHIPGVSRTVETITRLDLNGDGRIGDMLALPQSIRVEIPHQDGRGYAIAGLPTPAKPDALLELAEGVLDGRSLAEGEWTGAGRPYSVNEFRALRSALLGGGLARWRNPSSPAQGCELTPAGRAAFRRILEGARTHAHT